LEKVKFAIIGGSGFKQIFRTAPPILVGTPYGIAAPLTIGKIANRAVIFLPRHGRDHSVPPHKINYKANVSALHDFGVERIIALNAVGAINRDFQPGDIVIPHDFIDFTKSRSDTFYDEAPVTHVDFSQPYCPEIRKHLVNSLRRSSLRLWKKAVMVCTEGPRFETPAEIEMFRRLGCDVVGMTGTPEAVLARELEICYATLCYVSNMAAGEAKRLSPVDNLKISKLISPVIEQALIETVGALPLVRTKCPCHSSLKSARFA
jgi:5'-methylthioadenosine phosphorylase